jgi:hypothetical protein
LLFLVKKNHSDQAVAVSKSLILAVIIITKNHFGDNDG